MRSFAERTAINMPIQGTAADIIKLAMIHIQEFVEKENLASRMLMQVHDELVFEISNDELDEIPGKIKELMESAFELKVPLIVEKIGRASCRETVYIAGTAVTRKNKGRRPCTPGER